MIMVLLAQRFRHFGHQRSHDTLCDHLGCRAATVGRCEHDFDATALAGIAYAITALVGRWLPPWVPKAVTA